MSKALTRLSSGYRINSAADDPAGMAISEKMKAQLAILKRQKLNVMDSISALQVSEGVQSEVSSMLTRMQELAVQAMSGTLDDSDRAKLNEEYQQLMDEIDRVNGGSKNGPISLFGKQEGIPSKEAEDGERLVLQGNNLEAYLDALDGFLEEISIAAKDGDKEKLSSLGIDDSLATDKDKIQKAVIEFTKKNGQNLLSAPSEQGAKESVTILLEGGNITVNLLYSDTKDLGLRDTNLLNAGNAEKALNAVKEAAKTVTNQRSHYGAVTNRLEHTVNLISTMEENMEEALSRITDADMAKEMVEYVRSKAMAQAAMFVMSYTRQEPERVLQLLKAV